MWKLRIFRGGKYTTKEFETKEQALAYASKRKTGIIALGDKYKTMFLDGETQDNLVALVKGDFVKTIYRAHDDFDIHGELKEGKTFEEIFGAHHRKCGRFVVRCDDHSMIIGTAEYPITSIRETAAGFVQTIKYDVNRRYMSICKNEMMQYGFDDFFRDVAMTDEEEKFLRGQYSTAYKITKPIDWNEWRRYEAMCGGDYHEF